MKVSEREKAWEYVCIGWPSRLTDSHGCSLQAFYAQLPTLWSPHSSNVLVYVTKNFEAATFFKVDVDTGFLPP